MATLEEEKAQRDALQTQLEKLTKVNPDSLVRVGEFGQALSFEKGLPYFQRVLRLFCDLAQANLDTVPYQHLHRLTQAAEQANDQFSQIQQFSLDAHPQNPAQERDGLIDNIRDQYDSWFSQVTPTIAYSIRKGTDFQRLEEDALEQAARVEQIGAEVQSKGQEIVTEAQDVLDQVRRAAQEVGVAKHAVHFKNEANQHKTAAGKWLMAVFWLAGATALLTLINVGYYAIRPVDLTTSQTIQLAVAKVILFSLLFSALVWSGRVYRSHQHNFVVNQHRQNALTSFETFAKSANDDQTKSAVLLQATNCIFSTQPSGYADSPTEATNSPRIMEIIRNMTPGE